MSFYPAVEHVGQPDLPLGNESSALESTSFRTAQVLRISTGGLRGITLCIHFCIRSSVVVQVTCWSPGNRERESSN